MGIKDFLPSLKSIQKAKHVSEYSGKTVAIDGYCWYVMLHNIDTSRLH